MAAGFLGVALVLLGAVVVALANVGNVYQNTNAVAHTTAVKAQLESLLSTLVDAETGERGFIITGDPAYLEPYTVAASAIQPTIARARQLTADNPEQQTEFEPLSTAVNVKLEQLALGFQQRRDVGFAAAQAVVLTSLGKRTMDGIRVTVARMEAREDALLATRTAQAARAYRTARLAAVASTGVGLVVLTALFSVTRRVGVERTRALTAAERLRVTLSSIGDGVIATDDSGRVTQLNPVAETLTGWTRDEALGHPLESVFRIVNEASRQPVENPALRAMKDGRIVGLANHTVLIAKAGTETPIDDSGSPIRSTDGQVTGAVLVFRDVTERRRTELEEAALLERERSARSEMERAGRLKDEFLAVLSHELRTPLNAVLGYAQLLTSGALPPERTARALESIQRNAQAQARLVESLLDLSRIMAGKLELDLQGVDVTKIVDAAVDVVRPHAAANGISLEVLAPQSPITVVGDGGRLQQVLWNLLSNAIKFTPREGRVAIRWWEDTQVRIEVSDNGQGINAAFLPHVFDRFSQADQEKRRPGGGLGLGLALVREMVQAHGGTVAAQSLGEGRGSTFSVSLPVSSAANAAVRTTSDTAADHLIESLPPLEILIVDDDRDGRDLLALMLESRGAVTRAVSSATEALGAIRQRRPDVLLADVRMPDEDGYSLIRKIRAVEREQREQRLAAIAVTAYASPGDREQAITAGYDSHVAKPVDPGELTRAILRVVKVDSV